jgi:hypothetical protein
MNVNETNVVVDLRGATLWFRLSLAFRALFYKGFTMNRMTRD